MSKRELCTTCQQENHDSRVIDGCREPQKAYTHDDSLVLLAEGFSVKAHFLNAYRKALGAILRCQMIPLQRRSGGLEAFEAFAADKDMCLLGHYLGQTSLLAEVICFQAKALHMAEAPHGSLQTS